VAAVCRWLAAPPERAQRARDFRAMTEYRRHPEVDPVALAEIIGLH
jgi:hypothetical protein